MMQQNEMGTFKGKEPSKGGMEGLRGIDTRADRIGMKGRGREEAWIGEMERSV